MKTADPLAIDHEFSWDQMFGGFLPRDANPFRKEQSAAGSGTTQLQATSLTHTPSHSAIRERRSEQQVDRRVSKARMKIDSVPNRLERSRRILDS